MKIQFLNEIHKGYIKGAVINLQKQISVLAELILLECFTEQYLSREDFTFVFLHVFVYAKKDIMTYIDEAGRKEAEIVISPEKLINVKIETEIYK